MPISTHKPNMQAITRCWASAHESPLSSAKARTIKPPATHCPKTVKIISGHSCHPLPISHLLRVCQIASGIPGRAAIGIGFDHNIRFGKVSSRQRRNGRQIAMFLRSSSIGPKSSARSGQDSTQIGFYPPQHGHNNHRIWSYGLSFRYIAVRHTGKPYGSSGSQCTHLHRPQQNHLHVYASHRSGRL